MRKGVLRKFFSSLLAFLLVFSLIVPAIPAGAVENEKVKEVQDERNLELKAAIAEQLQSSEGLTKLHKELENKSGDEMVPVIIHLSENPVALEQGIAKLKGQTLSSTKVNEIRDKINKQLGRVEREMKLKGITYEKGYSYDTVLNGFAAEIKADDIKKLVEIADVKLVEPDTVVYAESKNPADGASDVEKDVEIGPMMDTSIDHLGIEAIWEKGYKGKGIKVAVLDTGIDPDHPEFQGIYKGGKNFVRHSTDYNRERAEDDARETSPAERPAHLPEINDRGSTYWTEHGTHVAGTIAAIGANEYGIQGIAPEIDLYAYRVLGAYGSGYTADIIAAVEESVKQEMDVINLSLGGGSNTENDSLSYALNNAVMADVIPVVSAGNSGDGRATVTPPGTSRLAITVGNSTNPETQYSTTVKVNTGDGFELSEEFKFMATTYGQYVGEQLTGEFEIVAIPGFGEAKDFEGIDVEGKVALISRGQIPFVDKIANAKENGAVAAIIHNFEGGTNAPGPADIYLGDSFSFIPTIDMSQTAGDAIREALKVGPGTVTFTDFRSIQTEGDEMNDSSSRGPSNPNFNIKPDVVAPGTNIMSAIPAYKWDFPDATYDESYERFTGTSMAAPHITGIAALIKQANPDWNAFDVKVALSNTAKLLDTETYDVFDQGAGRVDAYAAVFPSVLAYAEDEAVLDESGVIVPDIKGTVTFGRLDLGEDIEVTKQIRVKDLQGEGGDFSVDIMIPKKDANATITLDKTEFSLEPNGEQVLNVTLTAAAGDVKQGDELLGYIFINGGANHISLPFAAQFGGQAPTEIQNMRIDKTDLSFNGDGVNDVARLSFTLTGDVGFNLIEVWDFEDPYGGYYGDGYIGYLHGSYSLGAGSYYLDIDGEYMPWEPWEDVSIIPDGVYSIDFTAESAHGTVFDWVGPIFVKSTKPEISGEVNENKLTGQVTDDYIHYIDVLAGWGYSYDLNEKLSASFSVTVDGVENDQVAFELEQDGSFELAVPEGAEKVTVYIVDAAGNSGSAEFEIEQEGEEPIVSLSVEPESVEVKEGEQTTVTVTQKTTVGDKVTEEDVTALAEYTVADESVARAEAGVITGLAAGETTVTISYGGNEVTVNVTVTDGGSEPEPGEINSIKVKDEQGNEVVAILVDKDTYKQVSVEAEFTNDGEASVIDVTKDATYIVANENIAEVNNGVVTGKSRGITEVTVEYGGKTVKFTVAVSDNSTPRLRLP